MTMTKCHDHELRLVTTFMKKVKIKTRGVTLRHYNMGRVLDASMYVNSVASNNFKRKPISRRSGQMNMSHARLQVRGLQSWKQNGKHLKRCEKTYSKQEPRLKARLSCDHVYFVGRLCAQKGLAPPEIVYWNSNRTAFCIYVPRYRNMRTNVVAERCIHITRECGSIAGRTSEAHVRTQTVCQTDRVPKIGETRLGTEK